MADLKVSMGKKLYKGIDMRKYESLSAINVTISTTHNAVAITDMGDGE